MTIEEIIEGCKSQHPPAQRQLYERYARRLMGVCVRYATTREDAKDVFQESLIKIYKNISQLKSAELLEAWLRRVVVNTAINQFKQNKKHSLGHIYEDFLYENVENDDYQLIIDNLAKEDLVKLINRLAPGYRMVFNLYVMEGYSHKEIAELLQTSETNSKNQLMKAKRVLKKMLDELNIKENYERKLG